jgi:predicted enzyme related to lactoylglutathione lyase
MQRAKAFYESVFQVKLEKLDTPEIEIWAWPSAKDKYGAGGALVKMEGFSSGRNSTIVYFHCANCSVEAARILKQGGRIEKEKFSIGQYGFIALGYDTERNMIGLHSME